MVRKATLMVFVRGAIHRRYRLSSSAAITHKQPLLAAAACQATEQTCCRLTSIHFKENGKSRQQSD